MRFDELMRNQSRSKLIKKKNSVKLGKTQAGPTTVQLWATLIGVLIGRCEIRSK